MLKHSTLILLSILVGCQNPKKDAQTFLDRYNAALQNVYYDAAKAQWLASTDIREEHDKLAVEKQKAYARFVGSKENIEQVRSLLSQKDRLDDIQVRQLEKIWLDAAHQPGTIPDVVDELLNVQAAATNKLYSFDYKTGGKSLSANEIDRLLQNSTDLKEREAVWAASKEVGKVLREDIIKLQSLRNRVAREMGYSSFFGLETADYGMTADEMKNLMAQFVTELRPLYEELHTYVRYELAKKYRQPVPDHIPAHWLTNRWAQNWPGLVDVSTEGEFPDRSKEWIVEQAEKFYVSLGFDTLNHVFWEKSDLYPADPASGRKKNTHASAWHLDLNQDYRSLMSVEPNMRWFKTTHHELGHIYYYICYTNPNVPLMLRAGANRGYHEGIGDLMAIAASQRPYLIDLGLAKKDDRVDEVQLLLNDALSNSSVVFIPWSAGTMTHFEYDLYEKDLPKDELNKRWWQHVRTFQGVVPSTERGEEFADAATKTHIIDDPGQYYDYAMSCILKFQLHKHIAEKILNQNPRSCNYYGNKAIGDFLKGIMTPGASRDWRAVLREKTGEDLSAKAMLEYYQPLYDWLVKQNEGRKKSSFAGL
jgi:peptidyl-dipeptidase A